MKMPSPLPFLLSLGLFVAASAVPEAASGAPEAASAVPPTTVSAAKPSFFGRFFGKKGDSGSSPPVGS